MLVARLVQKAARSQRNIRTMSDEPAFVKRKLALTIGFVGTRYHGLQQMLADDDAVAPADAPGGAPTDASAEASTDDSPAESEAQDDRPSFKPPRAKIITKVEKAHPTAKYDKESNQWFCTTCRDERGNNKFAIGISLEPKRVMVRFDDHHTRPSHLDMVAQAAARAGRAGISRCSHIRPVRLVKDRLAIIV